VGITGWLRVELSRIKSGVGATLCRIAEELADEFEAMLPDRLAATTTRADAHRAKLAEAARMRAASKAAGPLADSQTVAGEP
jgi:hypothetical protein